MDVKLSGIVRWIVGLLFVLVALGSLIGGSILASLISLLIAIICIPVIATSIENKLNLKLSGPVRFVLVFVLIIGFGAVAPHTTPVDNQVGAETSEQAQTPREPVVLATWTGSAIKNTETFHVDEKEWAIEWDTQPGQYGDMNFQIYVYSADGTLKGVAANVIGANKDHTIMRGAGDYYLMINTAQPYTVNVYE